MRRFREISIHDLQNVNFPDGKGLAARRSIYERTAVDVPAVDFGCDEASLRARGKADALKIWGGSKFWPAEILLWTIRDVQVHGPYGVVTIGEWVIRETLLHVPFGYLGFQRSEEGVTLPLSTPRQPIADAWQVASGAYTNYYHWTIDILPKLQMLPFLGESFTGSLIMPPATLHYQAESAALLAKHRHTVLHLAPGESVAVENLVFIANMTSAGFAPHPCLGAFWDRLIEVSEAPVLPPRRLYIARTATERRPLLNEAEIIALVRSHGYEVCDPGAHSLRDQIALFRSATHIIAPHGAGLTNIIYCAPGTQLCELHMDAYVNQSYRRFSAMRGLRYGSVVGDADFRNSEGKWRHALTWTIDPDRVRRAVEQMGA
jgi:hypothetical protein